MKAPARLFYFAMGFCDRRLPERRAAHAKFLHSDLGARRASPHLLGNGAITHTVIVVQENRSDDNLLQFLPGSNTQS
jgi:phospholipase C